MKKQILFSCAVFACLSLTAVGQQNTGSAQHPVPKAVLANPSLKTQAEKIAAKELEIDRAAASSRAVMLQLKQELTTLNEAYKELLVNAISTCTDTESRSALESELKYVQQQLQTTNQR